MPVFRRTVVVVTLLGVFAVMGSASAVVITFQDLTSGATYGSGATFVSSTVPITVSAYGAGTTTVTIGTGALAAGAGNELVLDNARVDFAFPGVATGVAVQLGQSIQPGQSMVLMVNGATTNVASVSQLNGGFLGSTQLFVPYVSPTGIASLFVIGNVSSFAIGGSNLAMDNLIASWNVPEPATMSLLALGGLLIARRRRA